MVEHQSPPTVTRGATFGEFLRASRERRGISLQQIAHETKIGQRHLAALERGDVRFWPKGMYRRAMMRAYAESVGLDAEHTVQEFVTVFSDSDGAKENSSPPADRTWARHALPRPGTRFVFLALGCAAVVLSVTFTVSRAGSDASSQRLPAQGGTHQPSEPAPSAKSTTGAETSRPLAVDERAPEVEGELRVTSVPEGARVTVNGIGWGLTPLTIRYLPLGDKRVRLTKEGYESGERSVQLDGDRPIRAVHVTLRSLPRS